MSETDTPDGRYVQDVVADFSVIIAALNENRPLEALEHANRAKEQYEEEMENHE